MYSKKLLNDDNLAKKLKADIFQYSKNTFEQHNEEVKKSRELALMLLQDGTSPLTGNNSVKLLVNGENKFPEVLKALRTAKNNIHIPPLDAELSFALHLHAIQHVLFFR